MMTEAEVGSSKDIEAEEWREEERRRGEQEERFEEAIARKFVDVFQDY